jgi:hypothetical protein
MERARTWPLSTGCLLALLVLGVTSAARAGVTNLLVNGDWSTGDETGWTRWPDGGTEPWWEVTANGPTPGEGTLRVEGDGRSVGWYQIVRPSQPFETFRLTLDWAGDFVGTTAEGVARVRLFVGPDDPDLIGDYGWTLADVAFRREHTAGRSWDWQPASLCPAPGGNGGVIQRGDGELVVVFLELTGFWGGPHRVCWDNIVLTPEPATLGLVALGGLTLLRRRR